MPVQDHESFSGFLCQLFQSPAQFQLLTGERFLAEAAEFSERRRFDEDERADEQSPPTEPKVHEPCNQGDEKSPSIPAKGRATCQTIAGADFFCHVGKQFRAGMGIGVHKNQPVASGRRRPGISRSGDLIDRLKYDGCARRPRDFRRPVIGVIVADDQFGFPSASRERAARRLDLHEGFAQQFFLVEGRNDDGNFHRESVTVFVRRSNLKVCPDKFIPPSAG